MKIINEEEYFRQTFSDLAKEVESYTLQLFYLSDEQVPIPIASSILIKSFRNHYLLTAAHVYSGKAADRIFYIRDSDELVSIGGEKLISRIRANHVSNQTDLCIIQLDALSISNIISENKMFFDISGMNLDMDIDKSDLLMLYGYPWRHTNVNQDRKRIIHKPYRYLTKLTDHPDKDYVQPWLVQVKYTKNKAGRLGQTHTHRGPEPEGMSGGGIWKPTRTLYDKNESITYCLVGIMTEYLRDRSIIVGTRMNIINDALVYRFKEPIVPARSLLKYDIF